MNNDNGHKNMIDQLKEKITNNITDIEARDDLSANEKSTQIIHIFSAACAGIAVQPIPFADIFILTPIQAYMAERLAAVRGVPITESSAKEITTDLAKVVGLGMVAQQVALGLYKVGLPFLAGFTTVPLVYGLTYGIGNVLDYLFIERQKGNKLSPDDIRTLWMAAKKEGLKKGKDYRAETKNKNKNKNKDKNQK